MELLSLEIKSGPLIHVNLVGGFKAFSLLLQVVIMWMVLTETMDKMLLQQVMIGDLLTYMETLTLREPNAKHTERIQAMLWEFYSIKTILTCIQLEVMIRPSWNGKKPGRYIEGRRTTERVKRRRVIEKEKSKMERAQIVLLVKQAWTGSCKNQP